MLRKITDRHAIIVKLFKHSSEQGGIQTITIL